MRRRVTLQVATAWLLSTLVLGACFSGVPVSRRASDHSSDQGSSTGPAAAADSPSGPSGTDAARLPPPLVLVNFSEDPQRQEPVVIAVWPDFAHSVQLRFDRKLDLSSAAERLTVTPSSATRDINWDQGTSTSGEDWAQGTIYFEDPKPGDLVEVHLASGVRGVDGSVLEDDIWFRVAFVESTRVSITLRGPGYAPGGEAVASSTTTGEPVLFRPGPAQLEVSFTQPVDRDAIWARLKTQLELEEYRYSSEGGFTLGTPVWSEDGRRLTVEVRQPMPESMPNWGGLTPRISLLDVADTRGLAVSPEGATLRWVTARPLHVYRSHGLSQNAEPVGEVAFLHSLLTAGENPVHDNVALTLLNTGGEDDQYSYALLAWDLARGKAVRLGSFGITSVIRADWQPDKRGVLVASGKKLLHIVFNPTTPFTGDESPKPETLYTTQQDRFIVGMAVAPDGRIALFEAGYRSENGPPGKVDLLVADPAGHILSRVKDVSDLVSQEGVLLPVDACWSPDGSTLAFTRRRVDINHSGNATERIPFLTLWQNGRLRQLDVRGGGLSWRPGGTQVLTLDEDRWRLYDVAAAAFTSNPIPHTFGTRPLWSPDGRYLALAAWDGSTVVDMETGKSRTGTFLPMGWGEDNQVYWASPR